MKNRTPFERFIEKLDELAKICSTSLPANYVTIARIAREAQEEHEKEEAKIRKTEVAEEGE